MSSGQPSDSQPASSTGGGSYDLRGIFDPGFNNILAAAIKIPQGWQLAQSFTREWRGTIPINKIYMGISSPDGHNSIEFLPTMMYHYEDGPTARTLRRFSEQHGVHDPTSLPPMSPVEYIKKVYLPLLAASAKLTPHITEEKTLSSEQTDSRTRVASGYVRGTLSSGAKFHLDANITTMGNRVINDMVYTIQVSPRFVQSDTDLDAAIDIAKLINQATVFNPEWQRQDSELTKRGTDEAIRSAMERSRINRDAAEARRQAINRNYYQRQRANDRVVNTFCDYLGDRVLYENPNTGERVKVHDGRRHVYQSNGGNVLTTDAPLNPNDVDWQELNEVETSNY